MLLKGSERQAIVTGVVSRLQSFSGYRAIDTTMNQFDMSRLKVQPSTWRAGR